MYDMYSEKTFFRAKVNPGNGKLDQLEKVRPRTIGFFSN